MTLTCSEESLAVDESLGATAPLARSWMVIEVPGPWGPKALTDCRLPVGVGQELARRAEGSGTTVIVARRPGRAGEDTTATRRLWLAHTAPGGVRMRVAEIEDARDLLAIDLEALARGVSPGIGTRTSEPVMFICANGRRDACCARSGGALARELSATIPQSTVWECSHLGGHRFAATALLLPWGTVHGRLDAGSARTLMELPGGAPLNLEHYRGRSALPRWLQAAEIGVRATHSIEGVDELDALRITDRGAVPYVLGASDPPPDVDVDAEVRANDGRAWRVTVRGTPRSIDRIESCGGELKGGIDWTAVAVEPAGAWR